MHKSKTKVTRLGNYLLETQTVDVS